MKLRFIVYSLLLINLFACSIESSDSNNTDAISLTDDTNTELNFERVPERIGCLTEICVDTLKQLNLTPIAVAGAGITYEEEFFKEDTDSIFNIGGSFFEPNVEDIITNDLDLVIGLGGVHENIRDALGDIPLFITSPQHYEDSLQFTEKLGNVLGKEAEAKEIISEFKSQLEHHIKQSPKDQTALIMYGSDTNFGVDTQDSVVGSMMAKIANYPWKDPNGESNSVQLSLEEILLEDPDILFVETFSFGDEQSLTAQLAENPVWGELQAVQTENVYEVRTNIWANGRGVGSLTIILNEAMNLMYPELEQ